MSSRTTRRFTVRAAAITAAASAVVLVAAPAMACPIDFDGKAAVRNAVYKKPILHVAKSLAGSSLGRMMLPEAQVGKPSAASFKTVLTRNPADAGAAAITTPADACAAPICKELTVDVPAGSNRTLYARISWPNPQQYAQLWVIGPDNQVYGNADVDTQVDKRVGNTDVTPLANVAIKNPAPGAWRIQARAVFGVNIPITGTVALAKGAPLQQEFLNAVDLATKEFTQTVTYNIVFVNRTWAKSEVETFRAAMPTDYQTGVLEKNFADGGSLSSCGSPSETEGVSALTNWGVQHYCGTAGGGATGAVPYFEPTKVHVKYRFLQADETWTRDLFAAMQKATTKDGATFPVAREVDGGIHLSASTHQYTQGQYITQYNASNGIPDRGAGANVTNPTKGDTIDAFSVEDWIFNHRNDKKYAKSFRDVETGAIHSGSFINPDPNAYYDPYYTKGGTKNVDREPQGLSTSWTFFAMDTFDGEIAAQYFRPNAYHYFTVENRYIDPDANAPDGPNFMREWGGRYRFFMHDLGAGPNSYEAADTVLTKDAGGSASYPNGDPPIWDYNNNPQWRGLLAQRTARDARTLLFGRLFAGYLYRPIPADSYLVANNNWEDCYSNPQCSVLGISHTDLTKIYNAKYVKKNLGAAVPYASFSDETTIKGLKTYRYLGCAKTMTLINTNPELTNAAVNLSALGVPSVVPNIKAGVPDPQCVGKVSDPIQEMLEEAKARGEDVAGSGVANASGASANYARAWIEAHRAELAPERPGLFTITNVSVVWPQAVTWDLPLLVGGIALGTPNSEAWGVLNNTNDRVKGTLATDCSKSLAVAPGCNGVPALSGSYGFSYTVEHESSHFLGLTHPHDFFTVDRGADGKWDYYGQGFANYGDFTAAPTTYAGAFAPYSVLDQDIIQRGHIGEYAMQRQDYLNDATIKDGMKGLTKISGNTARKIKESNSWEGVASKLYKCGDYLHAEYAMRNSVLAAQGVFGPVVQPRELQPGEKVLFQINPQASYNANGKMVCSGSAADGSKTKASFFGYAGSAATPIAALLVLVVAAGVTRSRRQVVFA